LKNVKKHDGMGELKEKSSPLLHSLTFLQRGQGSGPGSDSTHLVGAMFSVEN
jgi:hypothetical protein